ncbi:S9 family peptidase [Rhizosphaericola mali]|uniref:Acyl-peptide hydrolase n=1 Tax=Rhizosphaericola mali TaxID=2545455 RepID=A0A5P2FWN3_9BACT|nr:alpha/beta fold hydrolase [Rhizosphaericola mali]QES87317.1 S9 family peptidase [Rhizosphaericola mali]
MNYIKNTFLFLFLILICRTTKAQQFMMKSILDYPIISDLNVGSDYYSLYWVAGKKGARNIYYYDPTSKKTHRLTNFTSEEELEISQLQINSKQQILAFVRGGDHGGYLNHLPLNPNSNPINPGISIWIFYLKDNRMEKIALGDNFQLSPDGKKIAFTQNGDIWMCHLDHPYEQKLAVNIFGKCSDLQWSPDSKQLAFVSNRNQHSFLAIYTDSTTPIRYIDPSFQKDNNPKWSPDGRQLAFIRHFEQRIPTDSILKRIPEKWQIRLYNLTNGTTDSLYSSKNTLASGSEPNTSGGFNLNWVNNQQIYFLSNANNWTNLYLLNTKGKSVQNITPGNYTVEYPTLSPDKKSIVYSSNFQDIDRRHLQKVNIENGKITLLTSGNNSEVYPHLLADNESLFYLKSEATTPPLPVLNSNNKNINIAEVGPSFPQIGELVSPKEITFPSTNGFTIHGQLFLPNNKSKHFPIILFLHGGPNRQMILDWHYSSYYSNCYAVNQYLLNHGYAVLSINYRNGIGYGYAFDEPENTYSQGASEYEDILAATKWIKTQSNLDYNKIGVYGGSYGGYLTSLALSKNSDIFKAGVDLHGVHFHEPEEAINKYSEAPDLKQSLEIEKKSFALNYVANWTSPVLLIHGDDDRNVDFIQSKKLADQLENYHVPFEYLVIPDDSHHWMKYSNQVKIDQATVDFLMKHIPIN